jgi:DNA-binding winged helix-turn-helix (wHTH) protein/Tfp pilus assembly protein PilF
MRERTASYQFGPFRLDPLEGVLLRGEEIVPLTIKAFAILTVLIENRGHVVQKDQLLRTVWPDCFVEDNNLSQNISAVRRALGEAPEQPKYIETVPRRGYRFIGNVQEFRSETVPAAAPGDRAQPETGRRAILETLGILPFRTIGSECADFWGLGIADALINRLSSIDRIKVRPTASVLRYDGVATPDWATVGRDLKVDALLSGCIQRAGDRIRVTVQLGAVQDGSTLWSGQFDDFYTDIFAVEDSISRQVAQALTPKLTGAESRRLAKRDTESSEAHQAYLRGRYYWNRRTEQDLRKSIRSFQEAIDIDPGHALAYVGLADAYTVLGGYSDLAPKESYPRARAAAIRALEIDQELDEAHIPLGDVLMYYEWDSSGAAKEYQRVLESRPDYATAHHFYAWYLIGRGRFAEAVEEMGRAQDLDPLSPIINAQMGVPLYYGREYDRAIEYFRKAIDMDPLFALSYVYLGRAYLQGSMPEQAIAAHRRAVELSSGRPIAVAALGHTLAVNGETAEARQLLESLLALSGQRYISPYYIASIFEGLEDSAGTFEWLGRAYQDRCNQLVTAAFDPAWDRIRVSSEFSSLIDRVGFSA